MKRDSYSEIPAVIVSGVFFWLWMRAAALSPYNESGVFLGRNFNLLAYIGGAVCTFFVFLILQTALSFLMKNRAARESPVLHTLLLTAAGAVFLVLLYVMYRIYRDEMTIFPGDVVASYFRHTVPHKAYYLFLLALTLMTFWCVRRHSRNRRLRIVLSLVTAGINALLLYAPNMIVDGGGGMQHIDAYTTSITNVMHFIPFSETSLSIYGHYGLIYLPLVKLFGNSYMAIAVAIAVFSFITYFAVCAAADIVIENDWVFALTAMAVTGTTTILSRRGQYYQINPHRLLFPALVILLIVLEEYRFTEKQNRFRIPAELILGTLSLVWNLETGLFSVIILSAHELFRVLGRNRLFSVPVLMTVIRKAAYCIVSFLLAYGIVGCYNLMTGGSFGSIRTYIYPLMSGTYNVNNLRLPLPGATALYVFEALLFVITVTVTAVRQLLQPETQNRRQAVLFTVALSGCASIVYFLNRTAYGNMSIQHMQTALLLGLLADPLFEREPEELRKALKRTSAAFYTAFRMSVYFGLLWLAFEAAITMPVCASNRAGIVWSMGSMNALLDDIRATVPEDTLATGIGLPAIYQQLGWDTRCYTIDTMDMNDVNREYRDALIAQEDAILTSIALDPDEWSIQKEWPLAGEYVLHYAVRIKSDS